MIGWTPEALYHEALIVPRRAYFIAHDSRVVDRPGWLQIITPSLKQGGLNEVIHSELSPEETDAVIERTRAEYERDDLLFRWRVTPETRPSDLADRLAEHGFIRSSLCALAQATSIEDPDPPGVFVEEVGPENVGLFTRMIAEGFGMDPGPLGRFHRQVVETPGRRNHMFVAHLDDTLAGAANMVLFERSVLLQGAVVVPALRGRGVYRALVARRLRFARARGVALATVHANENTSAPILLRAGFEEIRRFSIYLSR